MTQLLRNIFWPDFCAHCQKIGSQLCQHCINQVCFIDQDMPDAVRKTENIDKIWSAVEYRDAATSVVKQVKYRHYWTYTKLMAQLMLIVWETELRTSQIDMFIPVPLTTKRYHWRGFNQSFLIAKHLGKFMDIPIERHALKRKQADRQQVKLNWKQRRVALRDFQARPDYLTGKTVCLIDDVTTTGSTLEACARALKKVGVGKIYAATFAAD